MKRREDKAIAAQDAKTDIGWGHQIRSYVLQPYQMVKDLRTGVSTSDTSAVLDGDLDLFMQAALAQKAATPQKKLYCWNDNGKKVCGDALPPEQAARARKEFSARSGRTLNEVDRALTAEERTAAAAARTPRRARPGQPQSGAWP